MGMSGKKLIGKCKCLNQVLVEHLLENVKQIKWMLESNFIYVKTTKYQTFMVKTFWKYEPHRYWKDRLGSFLLDDRFIFGGGVI